MDRSSLSRGLQPTGGGALQYSIVSTKAEQLILPGKEKSSGQCFSSLELELSLKAAID